MSQSETEINLCAITPVRISLARQKRTGVITAMMRNTNLATSPAPAGAFPIGMIEAPELRGTLALRLVDLATLMLRASAILVLLSPLLAMAMFAL